MSKLGPDLACLDKALHELRMTAPAAAGRSLQSRVQGALGWARRHTVLALAQSVLAAIALGAK
jgi:hypothetical protein